MIECIEEFGPEFRLDLLGNRRDLPCRKILAYEPRSCDGGSSRRPEAHVSRHQSFRRNEAFRLEEFLDRLLAPRYRRIADFVGPKRAISTHTARIAAAPDRHRIAGL